ncbi:MAG TPA: MBL fold metallo-hydrolase [Gaiellaceae bacterium]|jgi:phosphoribosyl 1,2-cyclic phosphodiesterase|nr:MBL fold metallo-hydrolase [Gaiellaceae bacterium]
MRLKIWGCRGSVPTPGPETVQFGGNTSCVEVSLAGGATLVLDAGTGIIRLGLELVERGVRRLHLLLTHLHLDHLEGLRFFAPLWDERVTLDIWGPPSPVLGLAERIARSFSPPLFPVELREVPARVTFHDVPREPWTLDGASLAADLVVHPGPTVGFRIEAGGSTLAYVPDHEPALAGPINGRSSDWISGAAIAEGADLLLHDAQYFEDEYEQRIGWGHSSVADAVAFTHAVGARRLLLFHHEPRHADQALARLEARAQALSGGNGADPTLAREDMVVELP